VEFMQQETTVNSKVYCGGGKKKKKKKNCVVSAVQNKRREMLTFCVVLLHDYVRPHTAVRTRALLDHFNLELFGHHPYSPDLVPSSWFRSQYFSNNEDLNSCYDYFGKSLKHVCIFLHIVTFFLIACLVKSSPEVTFRIFLVHECAQRMTTILRLTLMNCIT
jgi:hypothetical protein